MLSRRVLLWINRLVWALLAGAIILLGSIVSLGRYYLPYIEQHQRELVDSFNRRTGLQLSIGHLGGSWQRLSPRFVIEDLRLRSPLDAAQTVLRIERMELQFGIFRSLDERTLAISRLQARGVHLQLEEIAPGRWRLTGFSGEGALPLDRIVDFLAAIYRAELTDSTIALHFFGGGEAHLRGSVLRLQRAGDFRRLNLEFNFERDEMAASRNHVAKAAAPLRVVVETQGDPRAARKFSGRGYAEFRGVDLTPVLPAAKAFGVNLEHGRVDGASWLEWRGDGVIEARGRAAMPQLDLAGVSKLDLEPVKNIRTEFLVRDADGKRQLWLSDLSAAWHGVALKFPRLSATFDGAQPQRMQMALPELPLAPLLEAALADNHLPGHLRDIFSTLAPQGSLRNLQIDAPLQPQQLDTLRLRAQLQNISVQPWQGAPGVANASGYLDSGLRAGRVDLASDNFSMAFPHVYREPLHFDSVRGQVGWRIESDHVYVDSGPIATSSDAGRATAQVSLDLPLQRGGTPLMTLQVGLQDSAAQFRDRFIPYTLQPSLLQWLQRAIGGGDIPIGGFIYRGSLRAQDHSNRTVQLFLQARAAELTYQPEWPPLRDVHAAVWVDDGDLRVEAARARIYDRIALRDGEVTLRQDGEVSWLSVDTLAAADSDDILRLLRETPLRQKIGSALDSWHWHGPTQSQVRIGIPIQGARPQQIDVVSRLGGGTLNLGEQNVVLKDVRGELTYRSSADDRAGQGLHADMLRAKWFGKPVTINVATAADNAINIDAQGRIAMVDLRQWLHQPLFDYADGETAFKSVLRIANGATSVRVDTDLSGALIDLPAPYRKSAEQGLPLAVAMELNAEPNLVATLGDWADLHLRWRRDEANDLQLSAGAVRLGQTGKVALREGQFIITGAIASANLGEWRASWRAHEAAASPSNATGDEAGLAVQIREVHFDSAHIAGQTLHDLSVSGRRDNAAWTVQMRAEQIAGTLTVPDDTKAPWHAHLNYVHLPAPAASTDDTDLPIENLDPRDTPAVDLRVDRLWRGDEEFGWLETQLRPVPDGLRFDHLKGQMRAVKIEAHAVQPASLTWVRTGDRDRTEFVGRLAVDDIGPALQRWRYEPVLTSKRGHADISLQWPGRPDQFDFVQTDGKAELRFDDGRFLRASSSASGALKVVGIFNFANFLRRLQFDFSDVFKDGVSFDEMQGSFSMHGGVLTTEQPLDIKSPSSRFRLVGNIDFNSEQTDMELIATLPVASNLPWLAALTGTGLPIAAGVYVASKVFEEQFDKFSSATYAITGSWSDPQVKLSRVFGDQSPKKDGLPPQAEPSPKTVEPARSPAEPQP